MPSVSSPDMYRLQGPAISIAELAKRKPGMVFQATEEQKNAFKELEEQQQLTLSDLQNRVGLKEDKIYAQVLVNGKLFGTIYDSGVTALPHDMPGLLSDGPAGLSLAKARLKDITQTVGGEIKYSDFLPAPGGSYRGAEERPALTAAKQRLNELIQTMSWEVARTRFESSPSQSNPLLST